MLLLLIAAPCSAAQSSATQMVESRVQQLLKIVESQSPEQTKKNDIHQLVNDLFDFNIMSRLALSYHWKQINDAQRSRFVDLYEQLLEATYMDRILAYKGEKVTFGSETPLGKDRVQVNSRVAAENGPIVVDYRLINENGQWKVYDLIIENVSLAQNYRSQFNSILQQGKSMDQVLEELQKKIQIKKQ
ncbi:MAG: ABC transporter substrate-binding protein [Desulfobacteraceae bacterium]|nr:ABC transporter substrate-binding protein [Desulfobacteraceae bacterium]